MANLYRGRFAPSPTGPLHLGSMLTAVGSYLQAKHHKGKWLVRIEDLDPPREIPGASANILRALDNFGLHWDEDVCYQSQQYSNYQNAIETLKKQGLTYPCSCSRKIMRNNGAQIGAIGLIYPGTCRENKNDKYFEFSTRLKVENKATRFNDLLQGNVTQTLAIDIGDIILKRADGLYAYHLAVAVDDHLQKITEVVRGYDLLSCTPIQIYLQKCLNYKLVKYAHLPIIVNAQNKKLSKQTGAMSIEKESPEPLLFKILVFLNQNPPQELLYANKYELLDWATIHWNIHQCSGEMLKT